MKMTMEQMKTMIRALEIALEENQWESEFGDEPLIDADVARSLIYRLKRFEQMELVPF